MTDRSNEEIIVEIKELLESHVKPAVASHGGTISFVTYDEGTVLLELGGACSGCAGSTMTLKMGVENTLKHFIPEIQQVDSVDDRNSNVMPYYQDQFFPMSRRIDALDISDGDIDDTDN